jgi:hypothetical protein
MSVKRENGRVQLTIQDGPDVFSGYWPEPNPQSPLSAPGVLEQIVKQHKFIAVKTGELTVKFDEDPEFQVTLLQQTTVIPWTAVDSHDHDRLRSEMSAELDTLYKNDLGLRDKLFEQNQTIKRLLERVERLERRAQEDERPRKVRHISPDGAEQCSEPSSSAHADTARSPVA